jgi:hypothetical protein
MPESVREWRHNMWVTTKGLVVAVRRGESVEVDQVFQHKVLPVSRECEKVYVCVYSTTDTDPKYIKDVSIEQCTAGRGCCACAGIALCE